MSSESRKWKVDEENKQLIAPTGERFSVGFASMDSYPLAKLINAALSYERERSKPLVDALESGKAELEALEYHYINNQREFFNATVKSMHRKFDAALASVKESDPYVEYCNDGPRP